MVIVTLYSKEDCCLCLDAKAIIRTLQKDFPFVLEEVDITSRPDLYEKFKEEIPVVFINERKAFKYRVDPQQFIKKWRLASSISPNAGPR